MHPMALHGRGTSGSSSLRGAEQGWGGHVSPSHELRTKDRTWPWFLALAGILFACTGVAFAQQAPAEPDPDGEGQAAYFDDDEQETFPRVTWGALLDMRAVRSDDTVSFLDRGLGKARYGSLDDRPATLLTLGQASFTLAFDVSENLGGHVQLNVDTEPSRVQDRARVDLIEGFLTYRPQLSPSVALELRAGNFFPPVSLEHPEQAWSTRYTITPSAINAWIGEEVRTTGLEAGVHLALGQSELTLRGAAFGGNDPTGTLLAFRGWAMHDRQTGLSDRIPLAPLPVLEPGQRFSRQVPWVSPFREIDGRLGYYVEGRWDNRRFLRVSALRYDNRGDPVSFDRHQYGWRTDFDHVAVALSLSEHVELLGQAMRGRTIMGRTRAGGWALDAEFEAFYGMAVAKAGRHRLAARYDWFEATDLDALKPIDNNDEYGYAWTVAYQFQTGETHRLALEWLSIESDRPAREALGWPVEITENLFQASFRVWF